MSALNPVSPTDNPGLELLLNRRSCHRLTAPGPDADQLELIFQAGLRAPDFLHLRPYRFLCAEGEGRVRLGRLLQQAAIRSGRSEAEIRRCPEMPLRAPLVVTVVCRFRDSELVPVLDQQLCAGSAVLMMQLAARSMGLGGVWRSGWLMFDRHLHRALGLGEQDQIVGFLYLGTPVSPEPGVRPVAASAEHVEWL